MQHRLILSLLFGCAGIAGSAFAAPLTLNRTEAVSPPRRDPGTGICGSVVKFINQPTPVGDVDQATMLLNRLPGDPNLVGRASKLFNSMNISIGAGSEADLRAPMFSEEIFPYCTDNSSMPKGLNDNNIAMRIRGYLNIPDTGGGQPVTLAINCDDGCSLKIGTSKQVVSVADERSPQLTGRRARSVIFQDPGLYPIELVYYQNATTGYLEASRAGSMVFSGDDVAVSNSEWTQQAANFKPLGGAELYSAISGTSADCTECTPTVTDCAAGSYCGDGLCQTCNVSEHCGTSCAACPMSQHVCQAGKCIQCTSDDSCSGGRCDTATGLCKPVMGCSESSECTGGDICRPEKFCGAPPTPCTTTSACPGSQSCVCEDGSTSCGQKICLTPPTSCAASSDCPANYACDSAARVCKVSYGLYGGGFSCSIGQRSTSASHGLGLLALFGLAMIGLQRRLARTKKSRLIS